MNKLRQTIEDTFAEAAFAEMNVESGFSQVQMRGKAGASVRDQLEDANVAATYASAGDHETARDILQSGAVKAAAQAGSPLILVVGSADSFSDGLVEYALDMASRMKAAILALNINTVRDDAYAVQFKQAAKAKGVPFSHMVRSGQKDQIVQALSREFENLQYVMNEPPRPSVRSIPVYCPAPSVRRPRARVNM
jgi:hypothetical protein